MIYQSFLKKGITEVECKVLVLVNFRLLYISSYSLGILNGVVRIPMTSPAMIVVSTSHVITR